MNAKRWAGLALVVPAVAVSLALVLLPTEGERLAPVANPWLEIPAPDVEFETLDGGMASVADYAGELLVVNFWGTWCAPCRREIPELVTLQEALGADGTVVGIAVASRPDDIRSFMEEFGVDYPIWLAPSNRGWGEFDPPGVPFTLLIDASGVIRRQYLGPQPAETLASDIEKLTGLSLDLPEPG